MNKAFLEDFAKAVGWAAETQPGAVTDANHYLLQLYIAEKLWSIEQLLKNQEQR